jgi:hypothetical protein
LLLVLSVLDELLLLQAINKIQGDKMITGIILITLVFGIK